MKRQIICVAVALFSLMVGVVNARQSERFNIPVELIDGEQTTIAKALEKGPVYLKFWASWCQSCMKQMKHFEETHVKNKDRLTVMGVNIWVNETKDAIQKVIREKALSFQNAVDYDGKLAQAFNFKGTPYHLLIDQQGNVVHSGYEADDDLDNKIALLTTGKLSSEEVDLGHAKPTLLDTQINQLTQSADLSAILFVSTWCDWYLEKTRPSMSQNCINVQKWVNQAQKAYPSVKWQVVASRLWTGDKELKDYTEKYNVSMSAAVDEGNTVFTQFGIREFPTLMVFKDGKQLIKQSRFSSYEEVQQVFQTRL